MVEMDNQGRTPLPQSIREICTTDFTKQVRIFLRRENEKQSLILSNDTNLELPCFGNIYCDDKSRFRIPKELKLYLKITETTKFLVYSLKGDLVLEIL